MADVILGTVTITGVDPPEIPAGQKVIIMVSVKWAFELEAWQYLYSLLGWEYHYRYRWRTLLGIDTPGGFISIRDPNLRTGSRTVEFEVGPFEAGTVTISVIALAEYYRDTMRCLYGRTACTVDATSQVFGRSNEAKASISVVQKLPTCAFAADKTYGEAPVTVNFTDQSSAPPGAPITSYLWSFGDGDTSRTQNPSHTYYSPGTYMVTLKVTNAYGSDSASKTITVVAAAVSPVIAAPPTSVFPSKVNVNESFTPKIVIKNQGGPGSIYVYCMSNGQRLDLVQSQSVQGYTDWQVPIGAHTIDWYLGYAPTESKMVSVTFYTGPVGKPWTGQYPFTVAVLVGEAPSYTCPYCGETFASQAALNEHIRTVHPEEGEEKISPWIYIVGGLAVLGVGGVALYYARKK